MVITVNIYYQGEKDNAIRFAKEMISSGTVDKIRSENGNLKYEYFIPFANDGTILLIDSWENQEALDIHHASDMMKTIAELRNKYNLTMTVKRYLDDNIPEEDTKFIKK